MIEDKSVVIKLDAISEYDDVARLLISQGMKEDKGWNNAIKTDSNGKEFFIKYYDGYKKFILFNDVPVDSRATVYTAKEFISMNSNNLRKLYTVEFTNLLHQQRRVENIAEKIISECGFVVGEKVLVDEIVYQGDDDYYYKQVEVTIGEMKVLSTGQVAYRVKNDKGVYQDGIELDLTKISI